MTQLSDEARFIIIQHFVDDTVPNGTVIHPKKKEKKKGSLTKEIQQLIHDFKALEIEIDLTPYEEAEEYLRKLAVGEPYNKFIDSLLRPYMK